MQPFVIEMLIFDHVYLETGQRAEADFLIWPWRHVSAFWTDLGHLYLLLLAICFVQVLLCKVRGNFSVQLKSMGKSDTHMIIATRNSEGINTCRSTQELFFWPLDTCRSTPIQKAWRYTERDPSFQLAQLPGSPKCFLNSILDFFNDGSWWEIIIIKQTHTYTSNIFRCQKYVAGVRVDLLDD